MSKLGDFYLSNSQVCDSAVNYAQLSTVYTIVHYLLILLVVKRLLYVFKININIIHFIRVHIFIINYFFISTLSHMLLPYDIGAGTYVP